MTLIVLFLVLGTLALVAIIWLARGGDYGLGSRVPHPSEFQPIDVEAFRNLMDDGEEAFLRENLPSGEFRRVHRERMLAAIEYVRAAYRNAGRLVQIAQIAMQSNDPALASAAANLFDNATQLRWYAFQVIPRLYLSLLLPGHSDVSRRLVDRYDSVSRQALVLSCLGSTQQNAL